MIKKFFNQTQASRKKIYTCDIKQLFIKVETFFCNILFRDLDDLNIMKIVTYPNPDINNQIIIDKINDRADRSDYKIFKYLGSEYPKFLKHCEFIAGNTSSGIIEAPYFNKFF